VYHHASYRSNRQASENVHDRRRIKRCGNSRISTHILEGKVWEMIEETLLDPAQLRPCIKNEPRRDDQSIARELARIAKSSPRKEVWPVGHNSTEIGFLTDRAFSLPPARC
jgi:hypothetical protein